MSLSDNGKLDIIAKNINRFGGYLCCELCGKRLYKSEEFEIDEDYKVGNNKVHKVLHCKNGCPDKVTRSRKFDGSGFLTRICSFDRNTDEIKKVIEELSKKVEGETNDSETKGIWIMFGKTILGWEAIEVGKSDNIYLELRDDVKMMVPRSNNGKSKSTFSNSLFFYSDRRHAKYKHIANFYKSIIIYSVDASQLQEGNDNHQWDAFDYAEVKLANDTNARFWNPAPDRNENGSDASSSQKEILKELSGDKVTKLRIVYEKVPLSKKNQTCTNTKSV